MWCCSWSCLVMHCVLHNPCKWVVCKVGCNDPVTAANYAATKVDTMDRKLQCDIMTSSLPRDRAASVLMWLANTSKSVPFLQTFHRSDRYEHSYSQKRQRTGRHSLQDDIFATLSQTELLMWVWWRAARGYLVAVFLIKFYCCWSDGSSGRTLTPIQSCSHNTRGRDLDIFLLQFFML